MVMILRVDTWALVFMVPCVCAILIFKYDRWILGYGILAGFALLFGMMGFSLLIHGFDAGV